MRGQRVQPDLIFDVGACNGDDTAHYLASGYRVVAVEANPAMADHCRRRFAQEITERRLTVEQVAIWEDPGQRTLWVNDSNPDHTSLIPESGQRNGRYHEVTVDCVPLGDLFDRHGVPYYLKVDIESADQWCLRAIRPDDRPVYVSVEAHRGWYLGLLYTAGYNAFKCVDQSCHNQPFTVNNDTFLGRLRVRALHEERSILRKLGHNNAGPYPQGSSGPFGENTPSGWVDYENASYEFLHQRFERRDRGHLNPYGWFDFHATWKPEFERF